MEKATRALRRSGVKLLSLGGANSDLSVTLSEVKNMRTSAKAFMSAQNLASRDMSRWAAHEENRAIQDVINQMTELNLLWTEVQTEFLDNLKEYKQMFEMILAGEKQVFLAKQNYNVCEQKECKYRKELKRLVKKGGLETEIRMLQGRVQQAERSKELAYSELSDKAKENECIKLMRLKGGLLKVSDAYIEMSTKCSLLFTAQRDVVLQLPEVNGHDLDDLKYSGRTTTRYVVDQARNQIKKYRRNSHSGTNLNEPPPPYTPSPPDTSPNLPAEQLIVPVRNPTPPAPRTRQTSRTTPPPYEQVESSPSPTSDHGRLERRSLPANFSSGSEYSLTGSESSLTGSMPSMPSSGASTGSGVSPRGTMPRPSSRVISRPLQESCGRKSDTLPRTGSQGRATPRNPAPPIPQPRSRSVASTDSSSLSSTENLAQADSMRPVAESSEKQSNTVFRYDSRNVRTQSQNATYQSESLYSNVRSCSPVHVCPSGLSSPFVMDHIGNRVRSISEPSTPGDADLPKIEVSKRKTSDAGKNVQDRHSTVAIHEHAASSQFSTESSRNGTNKMQSSCAGIPETGTEKVEQSDSHDKTAENSSLENKSASMTENDLTNIPFVDSTKVLSPERSSNQTLEVHNIQNIQGTFEESHLGRQGMHNESIETGTTEINVEKSVDAGLLETDLDAVVDEKSQSGHENANKTAFGDDQVANISANHKDIGDDNLLNIDGHKEVGGDNNITNIDASNAALATYHGAIDDDHLPYTGAKSNKICDDLIDFGGDDDEYNTADEDDNVGAVGSAN